MKDGGPAFPGEQRLTPQGEWNQTFEPGMSLRDYFAAAALGQILRWEAAEGSSYDELSEQAYMAADAMLKARQQDKEQ